MSVLIIGANGSMGTRYQAILRHLEVPYACIDKHDPIPNKEFKGFIVATPTDTHYEYLKKLSTIGMPVLIEKPISKNLKEVNEIIDIYGYEDTPLTMMMQYKYLIQATNNKGYSYYDYFRTGNDGLKWDCLQIIALAKSEIGLFNTSPVWKCDINGETLSIKYMDGAYIIAVKDWLNGINNQDYNYLKDIHQKVSEFKLNE